MLGLLVYVRVSSEVLPHSIGVKLQQCFNRLSLDYTCSKINAMKSHNYIIDYCFSSIKKPQSESEASKTMRGAFFR